MLNEHLVQIVGFTQKPKAEVMLGLLCKIEKLRGNPPHLRVIK